MTVRQLVPVLTVSLTVLSAVAVCAQPDPPRLSVAAAGGVSQQFRADLTFKTAPVWQISVRGNIAPHLAVEGVFEQWAQNDGRVLLDQLISGPTGPIGRVGRVEENTHYRMRTVAFNALATVWSGRASFAAGGGAGVMGYDRRFVQETTGCDAAAAQFCRRAENTFSSDSFTIQAVVEGGAAITRRIHAFGRYDFIVPVRDAGFGHGSVTAGVRLVIR